MVDTTSPAPVNPSLFDDTHILRYWRWIKSFALGVRWTVRAVVKVIRWAIIIAWCAGVAVMLLQLLLMALGRSLT